MRITIMILVIYVLGVAWMLFRSLTKLFPMLQGTAPVDPLTFVSLAVAVLMAVNLFVIARHSELMRTMRDVRRREQQENADL